jgi:hypothetical protein
VSPSFFFHLRETFSLVFHPKNKIRNESNEGSDAAGNLGALTGDLLMILSTTTTRIGMVVTIVGT